jgi:hypothetical protein
MANAAISGHGDSNASGFFRRQTTSALLSTPVHQVQQKIRNAQKCIQRLFFQADLLCQDFLDKLLLN